MAVKKLVVRDHFTSTDDYPGLDCSVEPSMTDPSHAAELDINEIVNRAMKTGIWPGADRQALYGDFSDPIDFQESLNIVRRAEDQFSALSADVRKRFANDPALFLEFVSNPENGAELIKLGLAEVQGTNPPSQPLKTPPASSKAKPEAQPKAPKEQNDD